MTAWRSAALLGSCVAIALAARAAEDEELRLTGKVKSVASDGKSFEVQDARGTFTVDLDEKSSVAVHKASALKSCPASSAIHVLGHKREAGRRQKAFVQEIAAIVVGDGYTPPAIPADLADQKLEWMKGKLAFDHERPRLDGYELHVAPDRLVPVVRAGAKDALAPGKTVFVDGPRRGGKDGRAVTAKKVVILAPEIPQAEYHAALGL